jgi:26S proteasome regulatory subunit N12
MAGAAGAVPIDKARELLESIRKVTASLRTGGGEAQLGGAQKAMSELRMVLTEFPSLPPVLAPHASANAQLEIARSAYEQACILAVRTGDAGALERMWALLSPLYTEFA